VAGSSDECSTVSGSHGPCVYVCETMSNSNNVYENVYGADIMAQGTWTVHPVHLMNAAQQWAAMHAPLNQANWLEPLNCLNRQL